MYLRSLSVALLLLTEACGMGDAPDHRGCEADARATERAINSTALSVDKVDVFLDIAHERIAQGQDPLPSFIGCLTVADEAATFLGESVLSIRPRFSELATMGEIEDSGTRRKNASGRNAICWKIWGAKNG